MRQWIEHIVRAALESVCYQTRDLLDAMVQDSHTPLQTLRVDGGMAVNNWLLQFLADMLNVIVQRPLCIETSALGAVFLAGLQVGVYKNLEEIAQLWQANATFNPHMLQTQREHFYHGWQQAIAKVVAKA